MRGWAAGAAGLALAGCAAWAAIPPATSQVDEQTVHEVASQLRCVVCQSLSVADSPSETANQMRDIIRERLGAKVQDIVFDRGRMIVPALSVQQHNAHAERTAGPVLRVVEMLSATDPARLAEFRRETDALVAEYFEDNIVRQDYLMTRATKATR